MKFRKRVRVFPGFFLNLSKSGISTTTGPKGLSINFNKKGTYFNVGAPGTGLYDRIKIGSQKKEEVKQENDVTKFDYFKPDYSDEIKSKDTSELTSTNFNDFKESIIQAHKDKNEVDLEIALIEKKVKNWRVIDILTKILLIGLISKYFSKKRNEYVEYAVDLMEQSKKCQIDVNISFNDVASEEFVGIHESFKKLLTSEIKWDVTASKKINQVQTRSAASNLVDTKDISLEFRKVVSIKSNFDAIYFENKNGDDIYIYPGFVVVLNSGLELAVIGFNELIFNVCQQRFIVKGNLPTDSRIIDRTWEYVNKNGMPDKRFVYNPELPVMEYGKITFASASGLNEEYMFSNYEATSDFGKRLKQFIEK